MHAVLASLSAWYPTLRGRSPTRYSPVRHYEDCSSPFDLHVLGTPPAFILSQDQTLRRICIQSLDCLHLLRCLFLKIYSSELTEFRLSSHSSVVKVRVLMYPRQRSWAYRQNDRCLCLLHSNIGYLFAVPLGLPFFGCDFFIDLPLGEVASLTACFIVHPVSFFVKGFARLFVRHSQTAGASLTHTAKQNYTSIWQVVKVKF